MSLGPEQNVFISCWFKHWMEEELKAWVTPLLPSYHAISGICSMDCEAVKIFSCFYISQPSFPEHSCSEVEIPGTRYEPQQGSAAVKCVPFPPFASLPSPSAIWNLEKSQ